MVAPTEAAALTEAATAAALTEVTAKAATLVEATELSLNLR
jgi:hypothetical protein